MRNYLILVTLLVIFTGCLEKTYEKKRSITDYTVEKYGILLQKLNVAEFKCVPTKEGYSVVFYTHKIQNNFPATIQIDNSPAGYNVYFDNGYLNMDKEKLLTDIDGCMIELEKQSIVKKSWTDNN